MVSRRLGRAVKHNRDGRVEEIFVKHTRRPIFVGPTSYLKNKLCSINNQIWRFICWVFVKSIGLSTLI